MKYVLFCLLISWCVCQDANAHDDHLEYIKDYIVQGSFDGTQFKTTDNVCWEIYKTPHGNITTISTQLHVRQVECTED